MPIEHDIARQFFPDEQNSAVHPLGHGLINDSFVVTTNSRPRAVLQRINRHVFPQPDLIMENLRVLVEHVHGRSVSGHVAGNGLRLPEILKTTDGNDYVIDIEGGFWRALEYIEDARTIETVTDLKQADEVGSALGRFHTLICDLDPVRLHQTLPGFHDTPGYFARFLRALARPRRISTDRKLLQALAFVERRRGFMRVLEQARHEGKLANRPIHGDTKLDNFLFHRNTGKAVSLIDLDTVQPGLIHFDIGDCLRSCANPAGESAADIASVCFDLDIGRAILEHYLAEARGFLTRHDYDYLYDAIRLIPFELGLRFLTDHLEGDGYFKTERPGQNLHRAMVQFRLTEGIEKSEKRIRSLIDELTPSL
jgi:Ser/Thr protein kinase RdoA (MazF antagonist)